MGGISSLSRELASGGKVRLDRSSEKELGLVRGEAGGRPWRRVRECGCHRDGTGSHGTFEERSNMGCLAMEGDPPVALQRPDPRARLETRKKTRMVDR